MTSFHWRLSMCVLFFSLLNLLATTSSRTAGLAIKQINNIKTSLEDFGTQTVPLMPTGSQDPLMENALASLPEDLDPDLGQTVMKGDLAQQLQQAFDRVLSYIFSPNVTQQCRTDIGITLAELMDGKSWAVSMFDAWAKIPPGITQGRLTWPGDMLLCERVNSEESMYGQELTVKGIRGSWSMLTVNLDNTSLAQYLQELVIPAPGTGPRLQFGICLPASCEYNDHVSVGNALFESTGAFVELTKLKSEYPNVKQEYKNDSVFIGASTLFAMIGMLIILCTILDRILYHKCEDEDEKKNSYNPTECLNRAFIEDTEAGQATTNVDTEDRKQVEPAAPPKKSLSQRLIQCFSLSICAPMLFDMTVKPGQLKALDGIRFLSMTWVILGHTFSFPPRYGYAQNDVAALRYGSNGDWTFSGVSAAIFAVDTFFLLSGLLVGYLFLKMMDKAGGMIRGLDLLLYYVHRILRLLPLYGGVILLDAAYSRYLPHGPLGVWMPNAEDNFCRKNWWTNLLYVNNFVNQTEPCLGWSWYLANDMQFYIIAPLILIPLYRNAVVGFILIGVLWAAHVCVSLWLWIEKGGNSRFVDPTIAADIYVKPYARATPYTIGIILAYILFKKFKVGNRVHAAILWLVAIGLIAICVYVPYDGTKDASAVTDTWNGAQRGCYEVLSKMAWSVTIGWIIYACNNNLAGIVGDALSWRGWMPLSRLTFAVYLIHPIVMTQQYFNRAQPIYVNKWINMYDDLGFIMFSYLVAIILFLVLEAPTANLEKIILPRRR